MNIHEKFDYFIQNKNFYSNVFRFLNIFPGGSYGWGKKMKLKSAKRCLVYQAKLGISNVFFFWGLKGMLTSDSKKEISTKLTQIVEREQ